MSAPWIVRHQPRPQARARLFCFAHAGGGASAYRLWSAGLPVEVEVCAVLLPGREGRLHEPPVSNLTALVDGVMPDLLALADRPFALFGHSMGAVVAGEVARTLHARGGPEPLALFASSRRPAHVPGTETPLHPLSDDAFVTEIRRRYGGIPAEVLAEPDLMALLLPSLRADMHALETHRPTRRPPIACPIIALGGSDDRLTPIQHLDAWRDETSGAFRARQFPGGHFYIEARRSDVLAEVIQALGSALSGAGPAAPAS
jgi:medium-chain acyl-[acyl-carrier-protein] hydrolase